MTLLKDNNYKNINIALLALEADIKKLGTTDTSAIDAQLADINKRINEINAGSGSSGSSGSSDNSAEIDVINSKINDIRTNINNINNDISNVNTEIDTINSDVDSIGTEIETLKGQVTSNTEDITNLQDQITSNDEDITNLENKVTSNTDDIQSLNSTKEVILGRNSDIYTYTTSSGTTVYKYRWFKIFDGADLFNKTTYGKYTINAISDYNVNQKNEYTLFVGSFYSGTYAAVNLSLAKTVGSSSPALYYAVDKDFNIYIQVDCLWSSTLAIKKESGLLDLSTESLTYESFGTVPTSIDSVLLSKETCFQRVLYTKATKAYTVSNASFGLTSLRANASNLEGVVPATKGGTGQTTLNAAADSLINSLGIGTATPTDADYYVCQSAGGGTADTTYWRRPMSALWAWIKGKVSSVLGLSEGKLNIRGATYDTVTATDDNPHIEFAETGGSQPVRLTYTSYDAYQSPASLTLVGGQGGEYFIAPNIKATSKLYGSLSGNATSATKLETARSIQTNLASTSSASFNGTANITPGVKGILPVANGGTGNSSGNAPTASSWEYSELDLTAQRIDYFHPVIIETGPYTFADVEIASMGGSSAALYNQNRIKFTLSTSGYDDTPKSLFISEYACFDTDEITIGCIGYGAQNFKNAVIWLRGGTRYYCRTMNTSLTPKTGSYTEGSSTVTSGTNYYGGTNTLINIMFTPQTTITSGLYTNRTITAPTFKGNATSAIRATQDGNGNTITSTYATKTELQGVEDKVGQVMSTTPLWYGLASSGNINIGINDLYDYDFYIFEARLYSGTQMTSCILHADDIYEYNDPTRTDCFMLCGSIKGETRRVKWRFPNSDNDDYSIINVSRDGSGGLVCVRGVKFE